MEHGETPWSARHIVLARQDDDPIWSPKPVPRTNGSAACRRESALKAAFGAVDVALKNTDTLLETEVLRSVDLGNKNRPFAGSSCMD